MSRRTNLAAKVRRLHARLCQHLAVLLPPDAWDLYRDVMRRDYEQRRGEQVNPYLLESRQREADLARHNAAARAQYRAKLDAERQARARAEEQAQEQRIADEIEHLKQQARADFMGTADQFEAAWPTILREWQVRQSLDAMDAMRRELRTSGRYGQF